MLLLKKVLNVSHPVREGTRSCYKFMFDYIFDPVLGKRLDYSRLPKVISEMI